MLENGINGGTWEAVELMLAVCAARERMDNNNPTTTPPMQSFMGGSSFGNLRFFVPSCGIGRHGTRRWLNPAAYQKGESASNRLTGDRKSIPASEAKLHLSETKGSLC